jgi:hypothetical protein
MTSYELPPTPAGVDEEDWRAAVSAIRGYCNWHIAPSVSEEVTVDGPGGYLLALPTLYLTDVSSVMNGGAELLNPTWSRKGTMRSPQYCWSSELSGVVVNITHGYDEFPDDVLAVARSMARAGSGSVATQMTSGPHSLQLSPAGMAGSFALSDLHKQVLDRYRVRNKS